MKVAEFMKRYDSILAADEELYERDHSLRSLARHRAAHPETMRSGTAFDWEDLEHLQKELLRMDREGAGRKPA